MSVQHLIEAAWVVSARAENNVSLDERELVTVFFQDGFFDALGYGAIGEDVRLEPRVLRRRRADVVLRSFTGRPVALIEFKRPGQDLAAFRGQLADYTEDLLPTVSVLTNGSKLWLYNVHMGQLQQPLYEFDLSSLSEQEARFLYQRLYKRTVDWRQLSDVRQVLRETRERATEITAPHEAGGRLFLQQFGLNEYAPFGRLTRALAEALPPLLERSHFTEGAYAFWRQAYARDLNRSDAPASWTPLMPGRGQEALYRFMFALETAYVFLSRAMLAKAMTDARLPFVDIVGALEQALDNEDRRGRLEMGVYPSAVHAAFVETGRHALGSLFASDIFDWWEDADKLEHSTELAESMAEALIAVFDFDFSGLRGDLLGTLYQSYFDPETRKALGEFYTPPEVVEFILDQVEYRGQEIRYRRLLDPAAGSGTFLVAALQRYIDASEGFSAAETLRRLVDDLHIVGFDVNPFAVLMAQANYAALILPLYARALDEEKNFELSALPVFRTDSLRQEFTELEEGEAGQRQLVYTYEGGYQIIGTILPVRGESGEFLEVEIPVLAYAQVRERQLVRNAREYFDLLRAIFAAVREGETTEDDLRNRFEVVGLVQGARLASFIQEVVGRINKMMARLREEFEDGRFLQTIEDLVLSILLKESGQFQYHYVVGNPPYVRIQNIPALQREYWADLYDWAEGNYDIFIPFFERAVRDWLAVGGRVGYICSNRFMLVNYATEMRAQLPKEAALDLLFDMRDTRVFTDALNYPAIIIAHRSAGRAVRPFFVARAFAEPEDGDLPLMLRELEDLLLEVKSTDDYVRGHFLDAFLVESQHLQRRGWYLMPIHERNVFERLVESGTRDLKELTLTQSGGFQGWATSRDAVFVLRKVAEDDDTLTVVPRGGGPPLRIEKLLLRPWLFGRDVERWHVDWDNWYVFFPYFRRAGRYTLLPARIYQKEERYPERFPYAVQADYNGPFLDEDFPLAWKYALRYEDQMRNRESGRFRPGRREEYEWYGATYPRSIDYYEQSKALVQVSSTEADIAADPDGKYVFTAGGTSGVYGLAFTPDVDLYLLVGLLNSSPLDFFLKHVSTVYSGKAYSYGDQFIKLLPIRDPQTEIETATAKRLADLARKLTKTKGKLRQLQADFAAFPSPLLAQFGAVDLYPLESLIQGQPQAQNIRVEDVKYQPQLDGQWAMTWGRTTFILPSRIHMRLARRWLEIQGVMTVATSDFLAVTVPAEAEHAARLLDLLAEQEEEIIRIQETLMEGEAEVNELVALLYGLDVRDMAVVNDFLERF